MAPLSVPWGDGALELPLPDHWTVAQVAHPSLPKAPADWPDRLARSLNRPEGSQSLSAVLAALPSHGRIVLVLEDVTRHSPLTRILPIIVRELDHAGIADGQVEILFASGVHPAMTVRDAVRKIGPLAERFAWRCNNAHDTGAHARIGEVLHCSGSRRVPIYVDRRLAQADLRIVVTAVTPHVQAGFGGGAKMFVPGCAALETISRVHLTGMLSPQLAPAVGTESGANPMRRMIDAAGDLVDRGGGRTFAVQYILDADNRPAAMASGNLRLGQQMLAKQCAAAMGIVIDAPA
ncbi:MAG: lactate racemase domain-containing protein, partial [Planctomycetota bacterium]